MAHPFTWLSILPFVQDHRIPEHSVAAILVTLALLAFGLVMRSKLSDVDAAVQPEDGVTARNVGELVAQAKAKPGALTFCSAGNGTVPHLAGELFKLRAGVDIVHVPYKGGGPAIVDLVGGQVNMMFATPIEVAQHVQSGKLRVLATTSLKRLPAFADVPTLDESGYPGFEVASFFGVLAPAGTPSDIVARLAADLATVMELPDVRERFAAQSADANVQGPEAFGKFLEAQRVKWADIVKRSGAKVD